MKIKITSKEIVWNYIATFLSLVSNMLILPFMVVYLNGNMLGLWYIFQSIGGITALFDFGFNYTFSRSITYCWSGAKQLKKENVVFAEETEPDFRLIKQVILTCKRIYLVISLFSLVVMSSVGTGYIYHITADITGYSHWIAWVFFALAVYFNLYFGYYALFLQGVGAIAQLNKVVVYSKIVQMLLSILFLVIGAGLPGLCFAYFVYGLLFRVLARKAFYKYQCIGEKLEAIKETFSGKQLLGIFQTIWHNAWRDGLVSLANFLSNQATTIICSLSLSLTETGVYALAMQLVMAVASVSFCLYNVHQPVLQSSYINHEVQRIRKIMALTITAFTFLFFLGLGCLIVIGLPILSLIKPETTISQPIMLCIGFYAFALKYRDCYTCYFSSTNRLPYTKAFLVSSIVCIVLSYVMTGLLHYGIWGLGVAQLLSQLMYNSWYWPYIANKELGMTPIGMYKLGMHELYQLLFRRKSSIVNDV